MALATIQQDGGLGDITKLINLVKDQDTTSSTSSNITNAGVQQQINEILGNNQGLASVAGAQHSAGFYNSSTNTQLVNDLLTRSAATVAARNATTTTTQSKKAPLSKTQALLTIGSLALKNSDTIKSLTKSAYNKFTAPSNADVDAALKNPDLVQNTNDPAGFANLEDSGATGTNLSSNTADGINLTDLSDATNLAGTEGATDADVADALSSTGASNGADAAGLEGLDSAASASDTAAAASAAPDAASLASLDSSAVASEGDALSGLGASETAGAADGGLSASAATGWGALAVASVADAADTFSSGDKNAEIGSIVGGLGTGDIIRGIDSGNVIDSVNPLGRGLVESLGVPSSGGWIVCTELVNQGRMPRKYYVTGLRVFNTYRQDLLAGYYIWAIPTVALLKKKPYCLRSRIVCWIFNHRAEFLASRSNVSTARDTVIGQVISVVVYGFCWVLGMYIKYTRNAEQGEFV